MKRDFTLNRFKELLYTLKREGYVFRTFGEFITSPEGKVAVLRHDVDRMPENALETALMEKEAGIKGTYYFRTVPGRWYPGIIKKISELGHETGYHYETVDTAFRKKGGRLSLIKGATVSGEEREKLMDESWAEFRRNLERIRQIAPVTTAAMHGSPFSPISNLDLWKKYDYREAGIMGEPYLDIDFAKVLYLTDTGRRWDNPGIIVRDKVDGTKDHLTLNVRTTGQLIEAVKNGNLPEQVMITIHPQRWTGRTAGWLRELVWQNIKNSIKRLILLRSR